MLGKIPVFTILVIVFTLMVQSAEADRGLIPVIPGVSLNEPGQRAIIAWNGREEIIILSTNILSNKRVAVVEILPLPSMPVVERASTWSFKEIQRILTRKAVETLRGGEKALSKEIEVVFHEKIGVHDITVVKAHDSEELFKWIEGFLRSKGLEFSSFCGRSTGGPCRSDEDCIRGGCSGQVCQSKHEEPVVTTCEWKECYDAEKYGARCMCVNGRCQWVVEGLGLEEFKSVVDDYVGRGFYYYVLDMIMVEPEERSVEPILYRFNTSFLYYPLKITSVLEGGTNIVLYILTTDEEPLKPEYIVPLTWATIRTPEGVKRIRVRLSRGEVARIDLRLGELFENGAILTIFTYKGPLRELDEDLMIPSGNSPESLEYKEIVKRVEELSDEVLQLRDALILMGMLLTLLITTTTIVLWVKLERSRR